MFLGKIKKERKVFILCLEIKDSFLDFMIVPHDIDT